MRFFGASSADVYVCGKRVRVDPTASIGKGGEADVFSLGKGLALKLFKSPDHPDLAGDPDAAEGARARLEMHQAKLPLFPRSLPDRVVSPVDLATDRSGARILGYTMPLVAGAEVLLRWSEPAYRASVASVSTLGPLLADLHRTVESLHARGVVIGDFNDLNVLVRGAEAHVIDADSFQFGGFPSGVYTERFLDPLLADPTATRPVPVKPYVPASDWYAFAAIAFSTLLCVGPYGGVYRPKSPAERIPHDARPLRRITVFHPEVVYPRPAIPWSVLPDDLLHAFARTFQEDDRRPLPRALFEALEWSRCAACGLDHARAACPRCNKASRSAPASAETVRGAVSRHLMRATRGRIVAAAVQGGVLRYLVHEDGAFVREDGRRILEGELRRDWCFRLRGDDTLVARGSDVVVLGPGGVSGRFTTDCASGEPVLATTGTQHFRVDGGQLLRGGRAPVSPSLLGDEEVRFGDVLAGQTRLWVGERLGFGLYRAGSLSVAFVFDTARPGLADTVRLPYPAGQILGYEVVLGEDRVWVLFAARSAGRTLHIAARLCPDGSIDATARAEAGDGSWLGVLGGKCAVGRSLLVPTDAGVVKVEERAGDLVEARRFADTEPFVTAASALHAGPDGLFVVEPQALWRLRTN
jgi:hypothetical protein